MGNGCGFAVPAQHHEKGFQNPLGSSIHTGTLIKTPEHDYPDYWNPGIKRDPN